MRTASESTYSKPTTSKPTTTELSATNPTASKPTIAVQRTFNTKIRHAALANSLRADNRQVDYLDTSLPKPPSMQPPTKAIIDADAILPAKPIIGAVELRAIV